MKLLEFSHFDDRDLNRINKGDLTRYFRVGSQLCQEFGTPDYILKDLRSAMYFEMGLRDIQIEKHIVWNQKEEKCEWI